MIVIYLILLHALLTNAGNNNESYTIRIYGNLAEIIRPIDKLPLEFTDEDWNHIRTDSITLVGENVNVILQTITEKNQVLDGTEIYIHSPISSDVSSNKLIKGILVDEINSLVKIQHDSIADQNPIYLTVPQNRIYYVERPTRPKHYVNFTYTSTGSTVFVSYLQSNLHWRTQYQLNLNNDDKNVLIAMANIRNDGKSAISIDQAELICGDINLKAQSIQYDRAWRKYRSDLDYAVLSQTSMKQMTASDMNFEVLVEQGKELAGLYIFPINKPFTIDAKTNYLLPMFQPEVSVERYALISKTFTKHTINGKAQRSYRLASDRYLSNGNCIIREYDRVVGEVSLPNLAANDKYEFSLGEDADVIYRENTTLISLNYFNETESQTSGKLGQTIIPTVTITRAQYIYKVHLQLKNFKNRSVNIEYEQRRSFAYQTFKLVTGDQRLFIQDGSSIKSNITLQANTIEDYTYNIELIL